VGMTASEVSNLIGSASEQDVMTLAGRTVRRLTVDWHGYSILIRLVLRELVLVLELILLMLLVWQLAVGAAT